MAMAAAQLDDEEMRRLKREAAIRQKDEEFKRKRLVDEDMKRKQLERLKIEYEEGETRRAAEKLGMMRKQAKIRAKRKAENERLSQRRQEKILAREARWLVKANAEIQQIVSDHQTEKDHEEEILDKARERKHEKEQDGRIVAREVELAQEELDMKREEAMMDRESKRVIRAALRTDALKEEAQEELLSFVQNPFPVPLKQVLAGRIRPVPTCTELFAAHRDAKEDFEDLKEQDFEMRAIVRNQSLFNYVHDIQMAAENNRVRPPEPMQSDLMKKSTRTPKSPTKGGTNKKGGTQSPGATARTTGRFANKK